ncbi:MAG: undecaprenyl/decaprenyl-phosphate alpha-N-acetylglucosaminyl 1-phosphate transferase [Gammaproteobacteria bacterium]|nr:undecaprenyl/decaprenyl-phosphate alpha-N-acetylglucosaminyl 1-phosphate transferase [Gammaproteobacteria bacterium]
MLNIVSEHRIIFYSVTAFVATLILTPLVIRLALSIGAVDSGGYRKINKKTTPLMGGVAVALPFIVFCIYSLFVHIGNPVLTKNLLVLLLGSVFIVIVGVIDDTIGMRARTKLLAQFLVAVLVCATNFVLTHISVPFFGQIVFGKIFGSILSVAWIVGLINAFNLIDGVDGLASGLALIAVVALAILEALSGNTLIAYQFVVLAGCLLAFLFFNFYPAKIFLGDTGSMFLGYVIAMLTLMGTYKATTAVIVFAPLLVLGLPIFETLISMIRRYIRGVPIFASDSRHTHHRLLNKGYSQTKVVLMLYSVAILLACWAILSRVLPSTMLWIPLLLFIATLGWIMWLAGYICVNEVGKIFRRRQRNVLLASFAKYAAISIGAYYKEGRSHNVLLDLCRQETKLRFLKIWLENGEFLFHSGSSSEHGEKYPMEQFALNAMTGERLVVQYQFDHCPGEQERHDVAACLANIFSAVRLPDDISVLVEDGVVEQVAD